MSQYAQPQQYGQPQQQGQPQQWQQPQQYGQPQQQGQPQQWQPQQQGQPQQWQPQQQGQPQQWQPQQQGQPQQWSQPQQQGQPQQWGQPQQYGQPQQQWQGQPFAPQGFAAPYSLQVGQPGQQGYGQAPFGQQQGYPLPQGPSNYTSQPQQQQHHVPFSGGQPQQQPQQQYYDQNQINNDVQGLHKAMKGFGTDEKAIINILAERSPDEIQTLRQAYKRTFGKDLQESLEKETSGDFKKLLLAITAHAAEEDARWLELAMAGLGTNEELLIEGLAGRSNSELSNVKAAYQNLYNNDLEKRVTGETSGDLKRLLVVLLQASRDESGQPGNVEEDVNALYKAGEKKIGTDESTFIGILGGRSEAHLRAVFQQYKAKKGNTFSQVIKDEFSGDLKKALYQIVASIENRGLWVAKQYEAAMKGAGTDEKKLIRLTTRYRYPPGQMQAIKDAYAKEFGKSLAKSISSETSGDFKKLLLALIRESD